MAGDITCAICLRGSHRTMWGLPSDWREIVESGTRVHVCSLSCQAQYLNAPRQPRPAPPNDVAPPPARPRAPDAALTLEESAAVIGCSVDHVRFLLRDRQLHVFRARVAHWTRWLIPADSVRELAAEYQRRAANRRRRARQRATHVGDVWAIRQLHAQEEGETDR